MQEAQSASLIDPRDTIATRPPTMAAAPASAASPVPDRVLDITAETCPMTFVRTRIALDKATPGETLLVLLRGEEPRARVPATAAALGHEVVRIDAHGDGTTGVLIRRR